MEHDKKEALGVFAWFQELSKIPRGSGNPEGISEYLMAFGKSLELETIQDDFRNVVIRKKGSGEGKNAEPILLQAHMDMVCEKNPGVDHDFARDPIVPVVTNGRVYANGTTLGADDGLGVALIMELLSREDISYPPIEAVFTTEEETDMSGARNLDFSQFQSRLVLNLDTRAVTAQGAGETEMEITLECKREKMETGWKEYHIFLGGLKGGHTGMSALENRGNANRLLARMLIELKKQCEIRVCRFDGGAEMSTAYARGAMAQILVKEEQKKQFFQIVEVWERIFKREYRHSDPGVCLRIEEGCVDFAPLSSHTEDVLLDLLVLLPDGLFSINQEFPDVMECSSNIGVVKTDLHYITILDLIRSMEKSKTDFVKEQTRRLCCMLGAEFHLNRELPQWERRASDHLICLAEKIFSGYPLRCSPGTSECGIFSAHMPEASVISLAPRYYEAHSPLEHFFMDELHEYWEQLKQFLKELCKNKQSREGGVLQ